jgi:hypothetical protein
MMAELRLDPSTQTTLFLEEKIIGNHDGTCLLEEVRELKLRLGTWVEQNEGRLEQLERGVRAITSPMRMTVLDEYM